MTVLLAVIGQTSPIYMATAAWCTRNADTPANTLFDGRLVLAVYERSVTHPIWSRAGSEQSISFLEFVNTDGELDSWLDDDWKDVRVTLYTAEDRGAFSSAVQVGVAVVDKIEAPASDRVRLVCRSTLERLERVISTTYSDTISNEALRQSTKPITLGEVRWLDPVNPTLRDPSGSQRGVHDVADDYFEGIEELRSRGALATEVQDQLPSGTEYFVIQGSNGGGAAGFGYIFDSQSYRHAAHVLGQIRRGTQQAIDPTFQSSSTWDEFDGDGSAVRSVGSYAITGAGTSPTYIAQDQTLTNGQLYQLEVTISSSTGVLSLFYGATILKSFDGVGSTTVVAYFTAATGTDDIRVGYDTGASGSATITRVALYPAHRISTLSEVMTFCAVTRGTLTSGDLDSTALAAIDADRGYPIGWHSLGQEVRGIDLAKLAAQSFGVGLFQDAGGKLVPVSIEAPAVSAAYSLDEISILEIGYEVDLAPGLATRMTYGRNYAPHTAEDMAGLAATTAAAIEIRAALGRELRAVTTTETLHAIYADAEEREPLESILADETSAQAEIDRLCALYTQPRAFYTVRAFVEDASDAHEIEPGDTVSVTHSRYGLSAGKNLLVVAARSDFLSAFVDLILWG